MKTLENQTLLYDEDCPLCQTYTSAFIKTGMLDQNGRKPFHEISSNELEFLDVTRAKNEIALIDYNTKTVSYGIDSLLKVLSNSFPIIGKLGHINVLNNMLKLLYAFISYNRKVIIPSEKSKHQTYTCEPSFNYPFRISYIIFGVLITGILLTKFSNVIPSITDGNYYREFAIAFGQLVFQSLFLYKKSFQTQLNYYGNMITVSLIGALLLIPIIIFQKFIFIPFPLIFFGFLMIVLFMFFEHRRRVVLLQLPYYLCYSWVGYRIIVLISLLNLL